MSRTEIYREHSTPNQTAKVMCSTVFNLINVHRNKYFFSAVNDVVRVRMPARAHI